MSGDDLAYLLYLLLFLAFILGGLLASRRERLSTTVRNAIIWGLIFIGMIVAYGFSDTLRQQLLPGSARFTGDAYEVTRARDGHFYLTLEINGQDVDFVVDTGASAIVLTTADARAVGIDTDTLAYLGRAMTANGEVRTAPVTLDYVSLGELRAERVRAAVNEGQMDTSLLGMTYLRNFSEITIRGDRLILTP